MAKVHLIGIGECMVEFHAATSLGEAKTLAKAFGGDVLNTLVHAARNGLEVAFVTEVGNDPFGQYLLGAWWAEGIDISHAPMVEGINGVYFISVDDEGERQFTYRRAGSAAARMSPESLDREFVSNAECLFISGISQAISASAARVVDSALQAAGEDVLVGYDPNYRYPLWQERGDGLEGARKAFKEAADHANWLLPSYPTDVPLVADRMLSPNEAMNAFGEQGGSTGLAMKMGAEGVKVRTDGCDIHVPPKRNVTVLDTTGAGDAWNGKFLADLMAGSKPCTAARAANEYAGMTLAYRGAIPPLAHW